MGSNDSIVNCTFCLGAWHLEGEKEMIITILVVAITVIGILLLCVSNDFSAANAIGLALTTVGGICTVTVVLLIISAHVGVNVAIEENRIVYESLCERNEIISSDYEDVSKSDVIKDIAVWNKMVHDEKYWAYNPWTNWFHSKRVADELQMIERK